MAAGVTGHVEEMNQTSLEYVRRGRRISPENRIGSIDRMNGGGLYRRKAIEQVGYLSDRNLHGYEEFDLGVRLRAQGWTPASSRPQASSGISGTRSMPMRFWSGAGSRAICKGSANCCGRRSESRNGSN